MKPNLIALRTKGPKHPPGDSAQITRGLGGYTHRVRSRAPSGKSKCPLGQFYPNLNYLRARELHPSGALMRTLWQVKSSPGRFYLNHMGARGLLSGTKY